MNRNQYAFKKLFLPLSVISFAVFLAPLAAQARENKAIEATAPATLQQPKNRGSASSTTTLKISTSPNQVLPPEITTSSEVMSELPLEVAEAPSSGETEYYQTPIEPIALQVAKDRDTVPAFTPRATSNNSQSQASEPTPTNSNRTISTRGTSSNARSVPATAAPARAKSRVMLAQSVPPDVTTPSSPTETTPTTPPPALDTTSPTAPSSPNETTPATPQNEPIDNVQVPPVVPGRATRSGPSYIGVGGNIGLGDGDTALGEGSFAVFSKIGLLPSFSVRPAVLFSDDATILVPITYDFNIGAGPTDALGFNAAPYLGVGAAFSTGDGTSVDLLLTGGLDVPLSSRFTATGAVNVTVTGDSAIGILLGVGYNF
ncbi:MAG: hypothetical protein KME17_28350 [Cyanosarcina radialis HA8281-LM2]|nr:hypothetical protein [Cyanosarcina radialis HA8281-LM2]